MALSAILVAFPVVGDGTTTTYNIDLLNSPYCIGGTTDFQGPTIVNWFATDRKSATPTSAISLTPSQWSGVISGNTLTITFVTAPVAGIISQPEFWLTFSA